MPGEIVAQPPAGVAAPPAPIEFDPEGNALTIRITPRKGGVPFETFLRAMRDSLRLLKEIDEAISEDRRTTVDWEIVSASFNSPLTLQIVGRKRLDGPEPARVVEAYLGGLAELRAGRESPVFNEAAMERVQHIVRSIERDGIADVEFSGPGLPTVSPTVELAENVARIIRKKYYYADSSVEGRIETFDLHGKLSFVIYDIHSDDPIRCNFDRDLLEQAQAAIGKRVSVEGRVKYNRSGWPVAMHARKVRPLREAKDLPRFAPGDEIDITGGVESAEYVRRLRDAE